MGASSGSRISCSIMLLGILETDEEWRLGKVQVRVRTGSAKRSDQPWVALRIRTSPNLLMCLNVS